MRQQQPHQMLTRHVPAGRRTNQVSRDPSEPQDKLMKLSIRHALAAVLTALCASMGCIAETTQEQGEETSLDEVVGTAEQQVTCTPSQTCSPWKVAEIVNCCENHRLRRRYSRSCTEVTYACAINQWPESQFLCDGNSC
jgi:hypothetical protein